MKKKKTIITTLGLLLIVIVGATFAYYTSNTSFENVFNAGKYKITLTEEFVSPDNWVPGETIPKTVTAKNEGTVPAAVRISYTEQWTKEIDGVETDITSQVTPNPAIINFANTNDWISSNGYYYYKYYLEPSDETSSFISGVTLDPNLDSVTCTGEGNTKTCEAQNKASGAKYKLTFTIQTVQYDVYKSEWNTNVEITEKPNAITFLKRQVEDEITPGDIIGIGETEDFYVISTNAEKTVLLAKYNLLVGKYFDEDTGYEVMSIPTDTPGYGLQSVDAIGGYGKQVGAGSIAFSDDNYWSEYDYDLGEYILNSKYATNGASFDGNPYPYVYDENSNIYPYISGENGYVAKLIEMGAPSTITGRLISYEEAEAAQDIYDGVDIYEDEYYHSETPLSIITDAKIDYWFGSAYDDYIFDIIYCDPSFYTAIYDCETTCNGSGGGGIRPVIEIPTSALQ